VTSELITPHLAGSERGDGDSDYIPENPVAGNTSKPMSKVQGSQGDLSLEDYFQHFYWRTKDAW